MIDDDDCKNSKFNNLWWLPENITAIWSDAVIILHIIFIIYVYD